MLGPFLSAIAPVGATGIGQLGLGQLDGVDGLDGGTPVRAADGGQGFGSKMVGAVQELEEAHTRVDGLAQAAATGDLRSVQDFMVASTEAQLLTQTVTTVRNRGLEAFNEIMRMPI